MKGLWIDLELFEVSQNVSEVDVEESSIFLDHHIVRMSVADALQSHVLLVIMLIVPIVNIFIRSFILGHS